MKSFLFFVSFTSLLLCYSCKQKSFSKEVQTFILEKDFNPDIQFPYKPRKISVTYLKDSIFINKIFDSEKNVSYKLYLKNNEFFFHNQDISNKNYSGKSYLFLRNYGADSCYSVTFPQNKKYSFHLYPKLSGIDMCFSNLKRGNLSTTIHFNNTDTISHNEVFFYTRQYKFYRIALRLNNKLYWYFPKK